MDPDYEPTRATLSKIRQRIISSEVCSSDVDLEKNVIIIVHKLIDDCIGEETSCLAEPHPVQFQTLNFIEKQVCLTEAWRTIRDYVNDTRRVREAIKDRNFCSNEELAMIGELDGKEAENIYQGSQENRYQDECFTQLVRSYYFSDRLERGWFRPPDFSLSSYRGERFLDEHIVFDDTTEPEDGVILEDHVKREMILGRESYLMKLQEAMMPKRIGKFINKSNDEGAGSETKFHQAYDQKRKERLEKKKISVEAMMRKRIGKFINKSDDEGAGSETKFHQADDQKRKEMLEKKKISGKMILARATKQRFPKFVW